MAVHDKDKKMKTKGHQNFTFTRNDSLVNKRFIHTYLIIKEIMTVNDKDEKMKPKKRAMEILNY